MYSSTCVLGLKQYINITIPRVNNNILQYSVLQYGAMIFVNIFVAQYIAIILALKTSKDHVFPLKTLIIFYFYMKTKDTKSPYLTLF